LQRVVFPEGEARIRRSETAATRTKLTHYRK